MRRGELPPSRVDAGSCHFPYLLPIYTSLLPSLSSLPQDGDIRPIGVGKHHILELHLALHRHGLFFGIRGSREGGREGRVGGVSRTLMTWSRRVVPRFKSAQL